MSDLIQRIKDNIRTTSEQIRNIKISAQKTEKRIVYGFFRQDGSLYQIGFVLPQKTIDQHKLVFKNGFTDVVIDHIKPTHPRWAEYKGLKREVSLWLASLHVAKTIEESVEPSSVELGLANGHRPKDIGCKEFFKTVTKKIECLQGKIAKETVHA
jgi:hypothetical protein